MSTSPDQPDAGTAHEEREWLRITLSCIGDAVITTDTNGNITFLNPVAQSLTGWTQKEAHGLPLTRVFPIINEKSRQPVESPTVRALRAGVVVGLANHTLLIARDGTERVIDDSAAPIRNAAGQVAGVVLVFRDVTQRRRQEKVMRDALSYADNIIATLREPFVVLDKALRIRTANAAFYRTFAVSKQETENQSLFELDNGQWENPQLRQVLGEVLSTHQPVEGFEVERVFSTIGRKILRLNACRLVSEDGPPDLILLTIEDVTKHRRAEEILHLEQAAWRKSEVQYRRLFESARDGILILDEKAGKIIDANPFMSKLLGYEHAHFLGKELWEIGLFKDIAANRTAFQELQLNGYIRYDHLPLETYDKRKVEVEFISNAYMADDRLVIQCNIRDCSERFRLEQQIRTSLEEKEVLLKEIHHRVKNNLQVICSLLDLQGQSIQEPAVAALFRDSQNRVQSMALVHERLYQSESLSNIDFADYLNGLVEYQAQTFRGEPSQVRYVLELDQVQLSVDAAVPAGLAVNELVTNCLKYAFPDGRHGVVTLRLRQEGEQVIFIVQDDGVGIPEHVDFHGVKTFGLRLVAALVDQLHGKVRIDRQAGTTVTVSFPVDRKQSMKGTKR
jgi:PAS domain S-box-containing protein